MYQVAEFTERNRGNCFYNFNQFLDSIGYSNAFDDGRFSAEIEDKQVIVCRDNELTNIPISSVKEGVIKAYEAYLDFKIVS